MIDWDFIASLEGKDILTGYVPNPAGSRSGVTIATGVDLGQMTNAELRQLPNDLQNLVLPYLGLTGFSALKTLRARPLTVTEAQAQALDGMAEAAVLAPLQGSYDGYAGHGAFDALPDRAQTVICSVAYQYGANLAGRCPKFWAACVRRDWASAVHELENFGDAYQPRHDREAAYLAPLVTPAI